MAQSLASSLGFLVAAGYKAGMGRFVAHTSPAFLGMMAVFALPGLFFLVGVPTQVEEYGAAERLLSGLALQTVDGPPAPLAMMLAQAFALVPLGSLAARIAVGFALLSAVAAALLYVAMLPMVRSLGLRQDEVAVPLCVGTSWLLCATGSMWGVATDGGTQALALCLVAIVLNKFQHEPAFPRSHAEVWPTAHALGSVVLALCLLAWEAPLWAVLVGAAAALTWRTRLAPPRWRRTSLAALLVASIPGAVVVLRRSVHGEQEFGVIGASSSSVAAQALQDPWMLGFLLLALAGVWPVLRTPARAQLAPWLLTASFALGCLVLDLPFAEAATTLWPLVFFASGMVAVAWMAMLLRTRTPAPSALAMLFAVALCALGFLQLQSRARQALSHSEVVLFELGEETLFALHAKAVVLLDSREMQDLLHGANVEMGSRPDLVLMPLGKLKDASRVNDVVSAMPELRALAASLLLSGELQLSELQSLAGQRPVALELATVDIKRLYEATRPAHLLYELMPGGASREDVTFAATARTELYRRLYSSVDGRTVHPSVAAFLRLHHRVDALHAMRVGARYAAQDAIDAGFEVSARDPEFSAMRSYLADHAQDATLDVSPWLPSP